MLASDIQAVVKGEVITDPEKLKPYSRDSSIFELTPEMVVAPKNVQDIKNLVNVVREAKPQEPKLSLTVRAAGSDMTGGPLSQSIVVDVKKHLNEIKEISAESAIVEPGVLYEAFDEQTRRMDLFMPAYPASRDRCAVGGMVANNAGGEKTPRYGKVENFVLELKAVLADGNEYTFKPMSRQEVELKAKLHTFEGEVYKKIYELVMNNYKLLQSAKPNVSKNSAGYFLWNVWDPERSYGSDGSTSSPQGEPASDKASSPKGKGVFDLTKLLVGSQGTLGIITEIKFRLVKAPNPKLDKMLIVFLKKADMPKLGEVVTTLMARHPESLESYDDNTFKLGIKFFPEMVKIIHPKNILKMIWHLLPEIMMIIHGIPKLVLMAQFTGNSEDEVDANVRAAQASIERFHLRTHITATEDEEQEFWAIRRQSFSLLRNKIRDKQTAPFIDDFTVRPEKLPEFLPKLEALLNSYHLLYTIAGHPGDGNFHIIPLMNLDREEERAIIPKLSNEVYDLVVQFGGSITAEHNDGLIRTPFLPKMYSPEVIALFEQTKEIFDPLNIFNPGKKVNPNWEFALSHIKPK